MDCVVNVYKVNVPTYRVESKMDVVHQTIVNLDDAVYCVGNNFNVYILVEIKKLLKENYEEVFNRGMTQLSLRIIEDIDFCLPSIVEQKDLKLHY